MSDEFLQLGQTSILPQPNVRTEVAISYAVSKGAGVNEDQGTILHPVVPAVLLAIMNRRMLSAALI